MRHWTFAPARRNCVAVAGTAEFAVGFGGHYDFADPLNHDMVMVSAVPPDYPEEARNRNLGLVTVLVKVSLDEHGRLTALSVYQSSGIAILDRAALSATSRSVFFPAVREGVPRPSTYLARDQFEGS